MTIWLFIATLTGLGTLTIVRAQRVFVLNCEISLALLVGQVISKTIFAAEAEVYACVSGGQELVYLNGILAELNHTVPNRPNLSADNEACVSLCKQTSHHSITKHFTIKVHYLIDLGEKGELKLEYVPTDKQPADILIKTLGKIKID